MRFIHALVFIASTRNRGMYITIMTLSCGIDGLDREVVSKQKDKQTGMVARAGARFRVPSYGLLSVLQWRR